MHRAFPVRPLATAAVACAVTLVAACGSGVDDGPDRAAGPPSGIVDSLALVPDGDGATDFVVVNDIAAAADAAGLAVPEDGDDEQALGAYFTDVSGAGDAPVAVAPAELVRTSALRDAEWRSEVGFAPVDLTGDVSAGLPPEQVQALFGEFDQDAVIAAVESDPTWSDQLDTVEYEGHTYFSWGEDQAVTPTNASTVRRIGESARLFVDAAAGVAYWTRSTAEMEAALDTFSGDAPSLADDPLLGPLARALDERDAYSAILSTDGDEFTQEPVPSDTDTPPALVPYEAVATGAALADGQARLLLAFIHDDAEAAATNAERLEAIVADGESIVNGRAWSDVLDEGDVEVDDNLVIASFTTDDPRLWNGIVVTRDNLVAAAG